MSTTTTSELINSMEQLVRLNKSLLEIANAKTEIVKIRDITAFQNLQKNEQKHILAIQKINAEREQAVAQLLPMTENPTVTDCLPLLQENEREKLSNLKDELLIVLTNLQERNELNQQLLAQSLEFINASVQMLLPQQHEMNYGPPTSKNNSTGTKRIFQSEV